MNTTVSKRIRIIYIASIVFIVLLLLQTFFYCITGHILQLPPEDLISVSINLLGMFVSVLLILSLANDPPWNAQNRALFRVLFTLTILLHCDVTVFMLERHQEQYLRLTIYTNLLLFAEIMLTYTFWVYICAELNRNRKAMPFLNRLCRGALLLGLILTLINMKYSIIYVIDQDVIMQYGKYVNLGEITGFIIYIAIWYVMLQDKEHTIREKAALLSFQVFPILTHILSYVTTAYETVLPAYLISVMIIYINVFAVRSKKVLEQQVELDKQRTALMISQIQPHFLYNVLTTISNLCITDPEEAEETTILFAQYLRINIDSLQQSEPVPFKVELKHIMTYIELEKKRFGDKINVEVNCPETDFPVPVLGLQPIVENSIKHGIRGKETTGHLKITSSKVQHGYEVIIEDDGIGFDMNAPLPDDGKSHVGMSNVKTRLEQMCGATLSVSSSPGNGCRTAIFFPENS